MPRIAVSAPKCAKCGKSVYVAEQVIGPSSKPYHKSCLACSYCDKRLDSTLLVEHDGLPYCKNCHKAHLGQGKGGFGLAVPLRPPEMIKPAKPAFLSQNSSSSTRQDDEVRERQRQENAVNEQMSGINISSRSDIRPIARQPDESLPYSSRARNRSPTRQIRSIDDMVASGIDVPMLSPRNGDTSSNTVFQSMYGDEAREEKSPTRQPVAPNSTPAPGLSSSPLSKPTLPAEHSLTPGRDTIGTVRLGADALPSPIRKDPLVLSRERERGLGGGSAGTAKTYSPRTTPQLPAGNRSPGKGFDDGLSYSSASALNKMGLGSTINAAAVGTPLCARCERPVCKSNCKNSTRHAHTEYCLTLQTLPNRNRPLDESGTEGACDAMGARQRLNLARWKRDQ